MRALEQIAGDLLKTQGFCLVGKANPGVDNIVAMYDASHRGDKLIDNRSQPGVIIL